MTSTVRTTTVLKYLRAINALHHHLSSDSHVTTHNFTYAYKVSGALFGELIDADFLRKIGRSRFEVTGKPITYENVHDFLENRAYHKHCHEVAQAANDPVQTQMELVPEAQERRKLPPSLGVSRAHVDALEQRITALEQLLIKQGVA